jgi:N-acylglucosamine 2-epimerase
MITLHYKEEYKCVLENVGLDGSILDNPAGRTINPGHSIENSWFLLNNSLVNDDKTLQNQALNILNWHLDLGWDKEFGGVYYFRDLFGRPCEQLEHDMKLWWVYNEVLIATLAAHFVTGDEKYEQWYDKAHDYSFSHFSDKECGEWYGYLHRDGTVSHTQKGSLWKGPYHLLRCLILCEQMLGAMERGEKLPELL